MYTTYVCTYILMIKKWHKMIEALHNVISRYHQKQTKIDWQLKILEFRSINYEPFYWNILYIITQSIINYSSVFNRLLASKPYTETINSISACHFTIFVLFLMPVKFFILISHKTFCIILYHLIFLTHGKFIISW